MIALDYSFPSNRNDFAFKINFKKSINSICNFKEEVANTAKYIYQVANKPLYLCYSGGIDGEVIATAFLENSIPFTAITFRYPNDINLHDIEYAINFCKNNHINHQIVDIDPTLVYERIMSKGGNFTGSWFNYMQIEMVKCIDDLGGCAILGLGICDHPLHTIDNNISYLFSSGFLLASEWCKNNKKIHFPYFFLQNPEIYAAYITDPLMQHMLSEPNYFKNRIRAPLSIDTSMKEFSYHIIEKLLMFYKFWPDMERRPKYDGFEKLRPIFFDIENKHNSINIPPVTITKKVSEIQIELGI